MQKNKNKPDNTSKIEIIRHKRRMKRLKRGLISMVVLVGIMVFVLTDLGGYAAVMLTDAAESLQLTVSKGDGFPLTNTVENVIQVDDISGSIAVLGDREFSTISPTGAILNTVQHGYANPKITTSDKRVCIYNLGGTELRVESRKKNIGIKTFDNPILLAEYSDNGHLAVITESTTHKAALTVFASGFDDIYSFKIEEDYPIDFAFSSDSKMMALSAITPDNGLLKSTIYLLKRTSNEVVSTISRQGSIPLCTRFLDNKNLLVAYDNIAVVYDAETGAEKFAYNYPDELISVSEQEGKNTVFLFGDNKQITRNTFVVLDNSLQEILKYNINNPAEKAFLTDEYIYVFSAQNVLCYDILLQKATNIKLDEYTLDMIITKQEILVSHNEISVLQGEEEKET